MPHCELKWEIPIVLIEEFNLTGKVAIVTGGNGGIGRGIAIGLARAGADIVIAARNEEKTGRVIDEITGLGRRCRGIRCDVQSRDDIQVGYSLARYSGYS